MSKHSEKQIANALAEYFNYLGQNIIVPNVSWGFFRHTNTGDEYDEKGDVCVGILLDEYAKFLKNNFVGDEVFMMGMTDMREIHYSMAVTMDKLGYTLRDFVLLDHGVHFDKDTQTLCFDYYPLVVKLIEKHYKQIVDACKKYVERVELCGY